MWLTWLAVFGGIALAVWVIIKVKECTKDEIVERKWLVANLKSFVEDEISYAERELEKSRSVLDGRPYIHARIPLREELAACEDILEEAQDACEASALTVELYRSLCDRREKLMDTRRRAQYVRTWTRAAECALEDASKLIVNEEDGELAATCSQILGKVKGVPFCDLDLDSLLALRDAVIRLRERVR